MPPSEPGAEVPRAASYSQCPGGCAPIPTEFHNLLLAASRLLHPLSHPSLGPASPAPTAPATIFLSPSPVEPFLSLLFLQAMAASITKILTVAGIFQYALSVDLPAVKVTEELLRQHEEQRSQEMAKLQKMEQRMKEQRMQEQRMQEQSRPTQESMLLSACRQWWFWDCVEMILMLFGIYWLPSQRRAGSDSGSWGTTTWSAQEQMEEEDLEDKPLDRVGTSTAFTLSFSQTTF